MNKKIFLLLFVGMLFVGLASADYTTNMKVRYEFDGAFTDSSGQGNDGTLTGQGIFNFTSFKQGNGSLNLQNLDSKVTTTSGLTTGNNGRAISTWIFSKNWSQNPSGFIFSIGTEGVNQKWEINIGVTGGRVSQLSIDNGGSPVIVTGLSLANNTWYHLVVSYNQSHEAVFIDGVFKGSVADGASINSNAFRLNAGTSTGTNGVGGNVSYDDFRIYNQYLNGSQVSQIYDSYIPSLNTTLVSPADQDSFGSNLISFNVTFIPNLVNLTNSTIFIWNSTNDLINETTINVKGNVQNNSIYTVNISKIGEYKWNVRGTGIDKDENIISSYNPSNNTFYRGAIFNSFSEKNPILETTSGNFETNVSVGPGVSVQTAILSYNGTNFTATDRTEISDGNFTIITSIPISPGVQGFNSEVRNYEWILTLVDEISGHTFVQTSATQSQTVNELTFALCDPSIIHSLLNFTMFDELTGNLLNATNNATTFQATFNIGASPDSLIKNYSISNISVDTNEFDFCTNQTTNNVYVDMIAFFTAVDYTDKNYYLTGANLSTTENEISLFLIPESEAIQFFITVIENLVGVADVTVQVAKFFVGEGLYKTVEIDVADNNGEFTSYLELDKDYRFTIIQDGSVLGIIDQRAFCQTAPCTFILNLDSGIINPLSGFQTAFAADVVYNLSYNTVTEIVTFDFVDLTGLATSFRMDVIRSMPNQSNIIVSSQKVFTSSGSMTFNTTGLPDGSYTVNTYVARSPFSFIGFIAFVKDKIKNIPGALGLTGLMIGLLFILVFVFGMSRSPIFLILAIPISLQMLRIMGISPINDIALTGFWLIGGTLAFLVGNK